ncbi:glycosyl transferase family 1 [Lonsdalea populi]|uniref:Glycosyltransferase n=1 Tax=Lonsdalea populi TaxID=1172565 RepID=A0A3N0UTF1_9GAMM|nr:MULTISPECIES: glycosyltransferase family 4 protein [Lonsdalea]RAT17678.1 glycosyl transferase family 1 [Lonsdalea quercina]RAT29437.1 glycosyl transferase family 1 [Lonsdalea populi]RAT32985.1 glycosyl transferase family 1 [Lonsdalea populi]RAT49246.1 glycosyl transferase family 1 [Lonsdalea populi]RAT51276.1 glycosyl transferase family 1 [Lonsdalea populi]
MLKVLHFYKTYYPDTFGGVEQVIFQLSETVSGHDIAVTTLTLSPRGNIDDGKIGSHSSYYSKTSFEIASTPFSFSAIKKFRELAKQADIIHYHFPYPFMDILHFISGVKKPSIVSYHSDIVKQKSALKIYTPLMNNFLSSVDYIVASSPNYLASSSTLQKFSSKVKVIPYGLDRKLYQPVNAERLGYWRDRLGERFFLFVGAFRYYKGLDVLLSAMEGKNYPLAIVGIGSLESELKQQADDLGLTNTHFLGLLSEEDKIALLQLCCAVVFPSHLRSEAFGITLLEGAMCGKPLISCEIGTGTTYINIDGETGIVVPPEDSDALKKAMATLWDNPSLAKEYGEKAFARFDHLFTSERMAQSYIELYHEVMENRNVSGSDAVDE